MGFNNKSQRAIALILGFVCGGMVTVATADDIAKFAAPLTVEYERPPGVDYSQYDKLMINDLDVSDTKIVPPPWASDKPFKWNVSDRNVAALQKEFLVSMADQVSGNNGYEIVAEPEDGTIEMTLTIVSFMPYAERKEKVVTKGSGEMRISVEIRDALSGQLLAIYEGPQEVGQAYNENTDFSRQQNLKKLFDSWGRRLRMKLDEDHGRS